MGPMFRDFFQKNRPKIATHPPPPGPGGGGRHSKLEVTFMIKQRLENKNRSEISCFKNTDWVFHACCSGQPFVVQLVRGFKVRVRLSIFLEHWKNCFSYGIVLQNSVNTLSKMVWKNTGFCQKAQNSVHFVQIDLDQISPACRQYVSNIVLRETLDC